MRNEQITKGPPAQPFFSGNIRGRFDSCDEAGWVTGWIFDSEATDEQLHIEILADGKPVAGTVADIFRADLQAGIGDGRHGFMIRLPDCLFDGKEHSIEIREVSTGVLLPGLPNSAKMFKAVSSEWRADGETDYINAAITPGITSGYFGCIDSITENGIRGWVLDAGKSNESLVVSIFLEKELIGTFTSKEPREDIARILGFPVHPGLAFNWQDARLPEWGAEHDQQAAQLTFILEANGLQLGVKAQPKVAELYYWVATSQTIAALEQQLDVKDEDLRQLRIENELLLARNKELEELLSERDKMTDTLRKQMEGKNELLAIYEADLAHLRQESAAHGNWKAELQKDVQRFEQIIKSA